MRTVTVKADIFTALIESARYAADPTLPAWTDAHIPRTEKPVRFIPFVGSPSYTTRAECRAKSLRFPA